MPRAGKKPWKVSYRLEVDLKTAPISKATSRAKRRFSREAGKRARDIARSFIQYKANATSKENAPPYGKHKNQLKKSIQWQTGRQGGVSAVIIGPTRLPFPKGVGRIGHLEHGGTGPFKRGKNFGGGVGFARFKKKPFMGPTLVAVTPQLLPMWVRILKQEMKRGN